MKIPTIAALRFFILLSIPCISALSTQPPPPDLLLLPPPDAVSLLSFRSQADLDNTLLYSLHERFDYCEWQGVTCSLQGRVDRLSLPSHSLRGSFPPDTLSRLRQLRFLSLRNNSLSGPIPDLSSLSNLNTLLLDHNSFSGSFPPSLISLSDLRVIDFSLNYLDGPIPAAVNRLTRLNYLKLEFNRFEGSIPPLNLPDLRFLNVSGNNLVGEVPNTPTLSRFPASAFSSSPYLCGEIVNKPCDSRPRFFGPHSSGNPSPETSTAMTESSGTRSATASSPKKQIRAVLVLGFCLGTVTLVSSLLCFLAKIRNKRRRGKSGALETKGAIEGGEETARSSELFELGVVTTMEKRERKEEEEEDKGGNNLVFCVGEEDLFTLEQLMRATAEILGRGTMGATYKAKLDNGMIVTVKRMDRMKMCGMEGEMFERHMEAVGALRHPNLVPLRAYFQRKGSETLMVYDYNRNGSVFNLIHGSRSAKAKPLHWTSCLKIAEDVAQGLAYIHQASNLVHGNLKATNVLLGSDFEACITDYCLAPLVISSSNSNDDPASARYLAPETRKSSTSPTAKSDVYSFGVLLLELLSGKSPSEHPFLAPPDLPGWIRSIRGENLGEDDRLTMLIEVASVCCVTSPEQRPSMWQVLKMIQKIKTSIMADCSTVRSTSYRPS
ncbi:hypothetical protein Dimus_014285 [Dionaea muscipula]